MGLDQLIKKLVLSSLSMGERVKIVPGFFDLTLVSNTGAAWGMFRNYSFILTLLAVSALLVLIVVRRHFTYVGWIPRIALGLLIGGIAGNLMDRLIHGHVIDFLLFYIGTRQWPAFNVADSAICVGVGLYLIHSFKEEQKASADAAASKS